MVKTDSIIGPRGLNFFLAISSGSVALQSEFPGDEVELSDHFVQRPVPPSLALNRREQAAESPIKAVVRPRIQG